jgi:hypothetical protein
MTISSESPHSVVIAHTSFDVFNHLVESPDDFLGLLAYSLYKRHKIEWVQTHPDDDHESFKKVACTPQQIAMYRNQAEQMAKKFIDFSLEQLGQQMRDSITEDLLIARFDSLPPAIAKQVAELKASPLKTLGNHLVSGLASVFVALSVFGIFTVYADYQKKGGLEGVLSGMRPPVETTAAPLAPR